MNRWRGWFWNTVFVALFLVASGGTPQTVPPVPSSSLRAEFVERWQTLPGQQRTVFIEDARLQAAAQAHAAELCYRERIVHEPHGYSLHVGMGGSRPNDRVRAKGYVLPDSYGRGENQVESVWITHLGAAHAAESLAASEPHADHVLGRIDFFADQHYYGVGVACGAWYVLVTAPAEPGAADAGDGSDRQAGGRVWRFWWMTTM